MRRLRSDARSPWPLWAIGHENADLYAQKAGAGGGELGRLRFGGILNRRVTAALKAPVERMKAAP
jgi:hypothetical protein